VSLRGNRLGPQLRGSTGGPSRGCVEHLSDRPSRTFPASLKAVARALDGQGGCCIGTRVAYGPHQVSFHKIAKNPRGGRWDHRLRLLGKPRPVSVVVWVRDC